MKKIICLFIATLTLMSFNESSDLEFSIIGKWEGQDKKDVGYIEFQEDGYAIFEFDGQVMGGKEFEVNGKKGSMTYEIDYSKTPIALDFIVKVFEKENKLSCIVEKINEDQIRLRMNFEGVRPSEFNEDDTMVFKRVK